MKREFMMHKRVDPVAFKGGKWEYKTTFQYVRIMARAEGYAMVRIKGCSPYAVALKDLVSVEDAHRNP